MRRRNLLRSAATIGAIGGIGSLPGAAGSYCNFGSNPAVDADVYPSDVGVVGSRNHFVCYDGCGLHPDYGQWEYNASNVPCNGDELIVFVSDGLIPEGSADQVRYFRDALDQHYQGDTYPGRSASGPHDLVVYTWDGGTSPSEERDLAMRNGYKLAQFLMDYEDENGGVPVRIVSFGLGDHVGANAVRKMYDNGYYTVESLDFLAAVMHRGYVERPDLWDRDIPMLDFPYGESKDTYGDAIEESTWESDVWYRTDQDDGDGVFGSSVQLGAHGYDASDDVPINIDQHDVTGLEFDAIYGLMTAEWGDDECGFASNFQESSVYYPYYRDSMVYTHYPGTERPCDVSFELENGYGLELYATKDGRTPTTSDYDKKVNYWYSTKRLTVYHDGDHDIPALKVLIKQTDEYNETRTLPVTVDESGVGDPDGIRGYDIPDGSGDLECGATSNYVDSSVYYPYYRDSELYTHYPGTENPCDITFELENGSGLELYATKDGRTPTTSDYDKKVNYWYSTKQLTVYHDGNYDIPALKVLIKKTDQYDETRTLPVTVTENGAK